MKWESTPNLKTKLKDYTDYSVNGIKKICMEIGPRPCGSQAESDAQQYIARDLKDYADTVEIQPFEVRPKAFLGGLIFIGILALFAVFLFNIGMPLISLIVCALAIAIYLFEIFSYRHFIDFLFPKKKSQNVIATRKALGETKRHIILSGHIDSSYEWSFTYRGGKFWLFAEIYCAVLGLALIFFMCLAAIFGGAYFNHPVDGSVASILGRVSIAFAPAFLGLLIFLNYRRPVEGANDNLTGIFVCGAVLKYLADHDIRFENTDVSVLSTGGEEAGLRGAQAFAKKHKTKLTEIETCFIGADTMRDYEDMAIYTKDMSGTVKNHPQVSALVKKAGQSAGIELPFSNLYAGASDAAAISKVNIPATCLAAMNPGPPRYYHTRLDAGENLIPKTIEKSIEILLVTVMLFDENGLSDSY